MPSRDLSETFTACECHGAPPSDPNQHGNFDYTGSPKASSCFFFSFVKSQCASQPYFPQKLKTLIALTWCDEITDEMTFDHINYNVFLLFRLCRTKIQIFFFLLWSHTHVLSKAGCSTTCSLHLRSSVCRYASFKKFIFSTLLTLHNLITNILKNKLTLSTLPME